MKKLLLALAFTAVSATALAQPTRDGPPPQGPRMERHVDRERANTMRPVQRHDRHGKRKVWVPTHREHGRVVRGHYVWR
ncbi:hypothetical protein [Variovorax ginsengisoli]|uniref:Ni/Co efflux regulator RcnB n=1 Tax=Variovorax ginsengisoli TaxID=363844 RepID=A0ABT9S664_9BURK|nr:hypothetical protein [Variovorax ginsengisoli]MDP9899236.1 Ni/Co efflux regulator RcnB [Variovorax ginsengisoli]